MSDIKSTKMRVYSVSFVVKGPSWTKYGDETALTKERIEDMLIDSFWDCRIEGLEIRREIELE